MAIRDVKKLLKLYPERYKVFQYTDDDEEITENQYISYNGNDNGNGKNIGLVIAVDYPESGKCIIDTDVEARIEKGTIDMEGSVGFLEILINDVRDINFKQYDTEDDRGVKGKGYQIELPGYGLTFSGNSISDAFKRTAKFFDEHLIRLIEVANKDNELRVAAKKMLLNVAKNG